MAKASKTEAVTKTVVVEPAKVTLELSLAEATALREVLRNIGGCRVSSLRFYTNHINQALCEAGVKGIPVDNALLIEGWGGIYFKDDTKKYAEES
jgi:hypothetical protein